jgi:hypothetical protein
LTGVATGADSYTVAMGTGEFLLTGQQMDIESIGAIDCLTGTFTVTGSEITLQSHTIITLESGSFELDGNSMFVTDPLAQTGGSVFTKKKALLDCGCGCLNCDATCCPGTELPDATPGIYLFDEWVEGSLGCPFPTFNELGTPTTVVAPLSIDNGNLTDPHLLLPFELQDLYPRICYLYRSTIHSIYDDYAVEAYDVDILFFCTPDGALHGYTLYSIPIDGVPALTWVESEAGIECPECFEGDTGVEKDSRLWVDVYMHCPECNFSLFVVIDDIQVGPCVPDTLYSIRVYWSGRLKCR